MSKVNEGFKFFRILEDFLFSENHVAVQSFEEIAEGVLILSKNVLQLGENLPLGSRNSLSLPDELLYYHDDIVFEIDLFRILNILEDR